MKKGLRVISFLMIFLFASQIVAAEVSSMGLNLPNIQDISPAEQSGPKSSDEMTMESPIDVNTYRLGPGDLLAVHIIVGRSDLSIDHDLLLGADGKVFFPNIGEIYLSGLSLADAKNVLDAKIKSVYAESYKLSVLLNQPKKVKIYLSGMIKSPGPISVFDNSRISEVITLAGGVASGASNRYIYIKRKDANGQEQILKADLFEAYRSRDLSKDIRIQAGDVVEVPDANNERLSQSEAGDTADKLLFEGKETFVYVYGEVARSGRFEYVPGRRVSDYISYAGGPTVKALLGWTSVARQENGKAKKIHINVSDIIYNGNSRNDIEVMGGDVISVPGNFFYFADFASFVNMILLGLTLYSTVAK